MRGETFLYPGAESTLVRDYLAAVARTDPAYDGPRVPHPVDVHRVVRAA